MPQVPPERWKELSPYLDQALSLSGKERADFLDSFRKQNVLLAELLETLLKEHSLWAQDKFLENSPVKQLSLDMTSDDASADSRLGPPGLNPGSIGPYKLVRKIGEGGMGQVWLASQSVPGRHPAICQSKLTSNIWMMENF